MDFQQICRICLDSNHKETYDIYTSYYVKRNTLYAEMLSNCTKLKPYEDDGLPRLICKDCSRQLKRVYTFNIQCEESDKKLRSHIEHKPILNSLKSESEGYIKTEDLNVKQINNCDVNKESYTTLKSIEDNIVKELNDEIKLEPMCKDEVAEDSCWDDNDDNLLLEDSKSKKEFLETMCKDDNADSCWNDGNLLLEKIKSKKELSESMSKDGDAEDSCWDADDDNLLLEEIKFKKDLTGLNCEDQPKKKRGRKRKYENIIDSKRQEPESKLPHQCEVCGKFLSTKSNLKAHKICHSDLRPYKCDKCPSAFRGLSTLNQHKRLHTGETPYHCEYCPKQFSRRTGLVNHIRMHTGEKLFSCDICFKSFVQNAQLSIHMKRHKGEKPYLCQDCGKGFPIKADLKVHQRIHNGEKPYSCHLCNKTFATSGNLSIHVRIHNKEVRYKCKECQRGFVTCSAYNVHLKRHKGQRDYHCECGKTFYTSSALKQHKVVHTGEKNYKCKICDRKFSQSSHLGRHFKRDHAKPNVPEADKPAFDSFNVQKIPRNEPVKCEGS